MKKRISISLILLINIVVIAQHNNFNKEKELKNFVEHGGKIEEVSSDIYKLTYPSGESRVFNLNSNQRLFDTPDNIDETIINIWEIDTTKFNTLFTFWQKVQVANTEFQLVFIDDLNNNGMPELYGYSDYSTIGPLPIGGPVRIFERDLNGIFQNIFTYDSSTIFVQGMGDIHGTGGKEIYMRSRPENNGVVYRSDSVNSLPTIFDFLFYYNPNQINNMTFGDWDNNGITDCAFIDGAGSQHCIIAEFRDSINNFEELFRFSTTEEGDLAGFAIEDFDMDGKLEFVLGSGRHGNIYFVENINKNEYLLINQFPFPLVNAYMQTVTNDIDGNGIKEFWIGGQDFQEGITIYQCYESNGNNSYLPVARIQLRYSTSFVTNWIQAVDIDDDGISSGNNIFILKFTGSSGEHQYKLLYAKLGESTQPGTEINPVAIADLDGDGKKDLLIPFRKYQEPIIYAFSYILRQYKPTGISMPALQKIEDEYIANYPNPFNSISTVSFYIKETSKAQIKVFSSMGKEIKILLDEKLSPGEYNIQWEATDKYSNPLPSGVYFISLQTGNVIKTTKTILLK